MWPWEHLVLGYLLYSIVVRLWFGREPTDDPALVLAVATQFPDLVDKPLAWGLGVLPHGLSLAHSLLFAVPFVLVVGGLAARSWTPEHGIAVAVGYFSHLLGDLLYGPLTGGAAEPAFLVWPLIERAPETTPGFAPRVLELFESFLVFLATPTGLVYLLAELLALLGVVALWRTDGCPGLRRVLAAAGRGTAG